LARAAHATAVCVKLFPEYLGTLRVQKNPLRAYCPIPPNECSRGEGREFFGPSALGACKLFFFSLLNKNPTQYGANELEGLARSYPCPMHPWAGCGVTGSVVLPLTLPQHTQPCRVPRLTLRRCKDSAAPASPTARDGPSITAA